MKPNIRCRALLCALLLPLLVITAKAAPWTQGALRVASNGHYLEHTNGTPLLWIADTAWELPKQLTMSEVETYFQNRKNKGYTVIQLTAIGGNNGWGTASKQTGTTPFTGGNPAQPNAAYWSYMDWIVDKAAAYDLYLLFLPTWGSYVANGTYFNDTTAYNYGAFLGNRYKNKPNIIWCLGGDVKGNLNTTRWTNMANGIRAHDLNHLITYHPSGGQSSSAWFHQATWLAFNTYQSGHNAFDNVNADGIARADWAFPASPIKPTINSEPLYEDIPLLFWQNVNNPRFTDYDVRKDAYRSLFGGAFGHTYGHNSVWQMYKPGDTPAAGATQYWDEVLDDPGAGQMTHVRSLLLSRPVYRVPDDSIISGSVIGTGDARMRATRGTNYAFVYFPKSQTKTIVLGKIAGTSVRCYWYDTRTGGNTLVGTYANSGSLSLTPPTNNDWVLVIDNVGANFPAPGVGDLWYGSTGVTDSFSWVSTPSTIPQTGSFTVQVAYGCSANRDIVVNVFEGSTYRGHGMISRSAGTTGTATVTVPIQGTMATGPALIKGEFRPAGGIWSDSLINIYAYPTVVGASTNVHSGTWSARGTVSGSPTWANFYQQVSGLPANTNHTGSFWMKGSGKITLRVVSAGWSSVLATQQFTATSTWTQYTLPTFNTGANTTVVFSFSDSSNTAGTFYIDDTFLGVPGGTNTLVNPGYESGATGWSNSAVFSVLQNP